MTSTSSTSQTTNQTLATLLAKIGATPTPTSTTTAPNKTTLGQSDFLTLMTAQLKNQDPFQPQDNNQMIAQMAQFSTVTGITQLNTTLTGVSTQISQNRIATAANFVGKTVLVPGSTAMPDSAGAISGAIDLPSDATDVTIQISDPTGVLVKSIDLGANPTGLVGFNWDGTDAAGKPVNASTYTVTATMISGGKSTSATTDVFAPVTQATVPAAGSDPMLTVDGVGTVSMSSVLAFKY